MTRQHLALVYLICAIWGYNFIAISMALDGFEPFSLTVIRFVIVLMVLFPFLKQSVNGQWLRLAAVCLFNGGLHFALLFTALRLAGQVGSIAVLFQTYVPMSALIAVLLLKERISGFQLTAIAIAFVGVLVISMDQHVIDHLDAVLVVLCSALFLATGSVLMRSLKGITAYSYQAWTAVFSIPVLLPLALWLEAPVLDQIRSAGTMAWAGVLYSALLASVVGHGLYYVLIQRNPVNQVTPHLLTVPVIAVLLGYWLRDDPIGWRLILGGTMVLGGVLMTLVASRRLARARRAESVRS